MCWGRWLSEPLEPMRASFSMVAMSPTSSARLRSRIARNLASWRLSKGDFRGLVLSLPIVDKRDGAFGPDSISGLRTVPGRINGAPRLGRVIGEAWGGFLAGLGETIVIPFRATVAGFAERRAGLGG